MKTPMSEKTEAVKSMIEGLFPGTKEHLANKRCPLCHEAIGEFRDSMSMREYEISGMCQDCQDKIFGR
jgi:hypothetical protein